MATSKKPYKRHTTAEKMAYSKQFSSAQIKSYRAGKRTGFLEGIHAKRKAKAHN